MQHPKYSLYFNLLTKMKVKGGVESKLSVKDG